MERGNTGGDGSSLHVRGQELEGRRTCWGECTGLTGRSRGLHTIRACGYAAAVEDSRREQGFEESEAMPLFRHWDIIDWDLTETKNRGKAWAHMLMLEIGTYK